MCTEWSSPNANFGAWSISSLSFPVLFELPSKASQNITYLKIQERKKEKSVAVLVKAAKPTKQRLNPVAPSHVPVLTHYCLLFSPVMSETPMLPASLMLLNTAHEYLGRRSWCCNSDGALLRFYVSAAGTRLAFPCNGADCAALTYYVDLTTESRQKVWTWCPVHLRLRRLWT